MMDLYILCISSCKIKCVLCLRLQLSHWGITLSEFPGSSLQQPAFPGRPFLFAVNCVGLWTEKLPPAEGAARAQVSSCAMTSQTQPAYKGRLAPRGVSNTTTRSAMSQSGSLHLSVGVVGISGGKTSAAVTFLSYMFTSGINKILILYFLFLYFFLWYNM